MIEVEGVSKRYKQRGRSAVRALERVSLRCRAGGIYALIGPNGSGKTTLLRCVAGLLSPDEGSIKVVNRDAQMAGDKVRADLGFLTGSMKFPNRLSAEEILYFFGRLRGLAEDVLKARVEASIERMKMGGFARQRFGSLSMGQKQRTGIAQALLHSPPVLVLDEVTVGLDVLAASEMLDLVKEAAAEGRTVLFSTHIMGEVRVLADSVGILSQGRLIFNDDLSKLESEKQASSLEEEFIRRLKESAEAVTNEGSSR